MREERTLTFTATHHQTYRCNTCAAEVLTADMAEHALWHHHELEEALAKARENNIHWSFA